MTEVNIDFQQLERQKRSLINHVYSCSFDVPSAMADIWGIIHLLDEIGDQWLVHGSPVSLCSANLKEPMQIIHEHIEGRCIPLINDKWDCSDLIETYTETSNV